MDKKSMLQSYFSRSEFQRPKFKFCEDELLKMYQMRKWYVQNNNSKWAEAKREQYENEISYLQGELNYHKHRNMMIRIPVFFVFFFIFSKFIETGDNGEWDDVERGVLKQYGGLEEGAPEGEDTD